MSPDHFAILDQPRRPWLESDSLKDAFHRLAATHHPDVSGNSEVSASLNAAYATLRDPASRLRHLLQLEYPESLAHAATQVPAALVERFMEVATLKRELDVFLHEQSAATSPLAQALLAGERFAERRDLERAVAKLEAERAGGIELLQAEDAAWAARTAETGARLATLQQELAYLGKWIDQLNEGLVQLSQGGA